MAKNNNGSIKKFKFNISKYNVIVFIILVIFCLSIPLIIYRLTYYKKIITVQGKYIINGNYNIVDTDGNIYQINDLWIRFNYNKVDVYSKIILNKRFIVYGYGFRSGFFNSYKKINRIDNLED